MKRRGYEVERGEETPAQKRRRRRRLVVALVVAAALAGGVGWFVADEVRALAADTNACHDAAQHHLKQAETTNSTFHAQMAQAYSFQDVAGGDCTWPPEDS